MGDNVPEKERQPTPRLASWDEVARYAVTKLIDAVFSEKSPKLIFWVLALLLGFQTVYIYSLPKEARVGVKSPMVETADAVSSILGSNTISWLGWVLFSVAMLFFVPVTHVLWRRVQSQGHRLKEQRDVRINDRVSSRDERSIDQYDDRMKQKFGGNDDTDTG